MGLNATIRLRIQDLSGVGPARRAAERLAREAQLDETRIGRASILVSELATNIARHAAGRGSLALRASPGLLTVAAWDAGPGIADLARAARDGFSTGGTAGTGLGAVGRLSDVVDVTSTPGAGTVITAWLGHRPADAPDVDGLALPIDDDGPCGDAFATRVDDGVMTILLADGLGHGPSAAEASGDAVASLLTGPRRDPAEVLADAHAALRHTRGAAVSVACLDPVRGEVRFAGVGNVAGVVCGAGGARAMAAHNGIVGHQARRLQQFTYPLGARDLVVLHSDGVRGAWGLDAHPGLMRREALTIAATIIRDAERGRDDVSVVVARPGPRGAVA